MTEITTEIISAIKASDKVLICGHIRPDGDCIGSALAMRFICENLGKTADAVCDAEKTDSFDFLPGYDSFNAPRFNDYDLFIAVDCAIDTRLGEYRRFLDTAKNIIDIDHHPTNNKYGKINFINGDACSTCEIIFDMFEGTGLIDKTVATCLYTGLSTDTGHFMHNNTTAKAFDIAASLCRMGVDAGTLNQELYKNKSFSRIRLTAKAIDGIILFENGQIALMAITKEMLDSCNCTSDDTEGLIDYASSIRGVKISISMCDQPGGLFRVSFRSKKADVAAAAETFGGGGHKNAAGCIIKGNRYDVMEKTVAAAKAALDKLS
ncbi:MAG: bifunctional oligoribonuclease/PAP phosphatase NrnA [Clostridiales bacterium]|nr:bifunctional oligoribonuclease/PAP phosphatase NrnA [Clostridiales bacterium]